MCFCLCPHLFYSSCFNINPTMALHNMTQHDFINQKLTILYYKNKSTPSNRRWPCKSVSHFSKRSHSFLFIHTLTRTRQNMRLLLCCYQKLLVHRRRGHCKGLYVSNKCLPTEPLKIGQWVYTWIHFSAAAAALPSQCWCLSHVGHMLRQRHQADESAQCNNGQTWYCSKLKNPRPN